MQSLPRHLQIFVACLNLCLGIFPGALFFFFWVERNCDLSSLLPNFAAPIFAVFRPHLPPSLALQCAWNVGLFLLFGFLHSLFAQKTVQNRMTRILPPQTIRSFYLILTGVSLFLVTALWSPTHIWIWQIWPFGRAGGAFLQLILSLSLFWIPMAVAGQLLTRFGLLEFFGIEQLTKSHSDLLRTEGTPHLVTTGIFAWVRHPVYALTLLAFLLAPEMSLDRMTLTLATALYLWIAIPIEERKLIARFGRSYEEYRKRTPALLPFGCPTRFPYKEYKRG